MSSSSEISWAGKARKVRMRDKDARPLGEDVETFRAGLAIEKGYVRTYVRMDRGSNDAKVHFGRLPILTY